MTFYRPMNAPAMFGRPNRALALEFFSGGRGEGGGGGRTESLLLRQSAVYKQKIGNRYAV